MENEIVDNILMYFQNCYKEGLTAKYKTIVKTVKDPFFNKNFQELSPGEVIVSYIIYCTTERLKARGSVRRCSSFCYDRGITWSRRFNNRPQNEISFLLTIFGLKDQMISIEEAQEKFELSNECVHSLSRGILSCMQTI